jgi:ABC-2 type transport system permease protein
MINLAFLKKELVEMIKTPKLIIISSVFLFFSIIGPLTAKYMGELLEMFASDIQIIFPEPTHLQSWEQFYSNITSISMIVFLILMTGTVASEKSRGSVYLVLTKNMTRNSFIISKIIAGILMFTLVYIVSILITLYYTWVLFDAVLYDHLFLSLLAIYALGLFFTMVAVFLSITFKASTHAALVAFGIYALLNVLTILSDLNTFNPAGSTVLVLNQLMGSGDISALAINIAITLGLTGVLFYLSLSIFNKQEL